jgi:hypothetical protein
MCTMGSMMEAASGGEAGDFAAIVAELSEMPRRLDAFIAAIPREHWRQRPAAGGFSLVEHVFHLLNIDFEGYRTRLERMLTEERPALGDLDGAELAEARRYGDQDLTLAAAGFARLRAELVERLTGLPVAARGRVGVLEGVGEITVAELAAVIRQHDGEHCAELTALRDELAATQG